MRKIGNPTVASTQKQGNAKANKTPTNNHQDKQDNTITQCKETQNSQIATAKTNKDKPQSAIQITTAKTKHTPHDTNHTQHDSTPTHRELELEKRSGYFKERNTGHQ